MKFRWLAGGALMLVLAAVISGCATTGVTAHDESMSHYKLALARMQSGNDEAALYELNLALQKDNSNKDAHFLAGVLYYKRQNYDLAIEEYKKTISLDSKYADAYNDMGLCYAKMKQYDKALENLRIAADMPLNSNRLQTLDNIGTVYDEMGDYEKSVGAYREILLAMPMSPTALFKIAGEYVKLGKYNEAIDNYSKLLNFYPDDPDVLLELGKVYYKQGDKKQATECMNKVVEKSPDSELAKSAKEYLDLMK